MRDVLLGDGRLAWADLRPHVKRVGTRFGARGKRAVRGVRMLVDFLLDDED